jgi:hypothetical protein
LSPSATPGGRGARATDQPEGSRRTVGEQLGSASVEMVKGDAVNRYLDGLQLRAAGAQLADNRKRVQLVMRE